MGYCSRWLDRVWDWINAVGECIHSAFVDTGAPDPMRELPGQMFEGLLECVAWLWPWGR